MPIHESLKAIVEEAKSELDEMKGRCEQREERASRVIDDAMGRMKGLVEFAEGLPQKMLERFSTVLVGEYDEKRFGKQGPITFCELRMNGLSVHMSGLLGREIKLDGRYRIVTILEKID